MPYKIENKLVVGVSSSALFNLEEEDEIFRTNGVEAYKTYQREHEHIKLEKGLAFPFVRRFLNINKVYTEEKPVEVVLLSKNSPETGLRIFNSIKEYDLDISRAAFTSGDSPYEYIPAFNISLFLSINDEDVRNAISHNFPAGKILNTKVEDNESDIELRVAFDFDGVIVDDESEKVYAKANQLDDFNQYESKNIHNPMHHGLLSDFFTKISYFQKLEAKKKDADPSYQKILETAIITARSAPAHERAINTLNSWGVEVDKMFLLGGMQKARILSVFKPHLFLDDQLAHLDKDLTNIPLVHIPFGVRNLRQE